MNDKYKNLIISVYLNTIILIFPFVIASFYNEMIQVKSVTISVAMFLMSIAIGTSEKMIFYSFLTFSLFLVAIYGSIPNQSYMSSPWHYQIWFAVAGEVALIFDKYDVHVRRGEPLHKF